MLSKLRFIYFMLCLFMYANIIYGNEINKLDDLLDESISLSDKLEYLDSIKRNNNNNNSFSEKDVGTLVVMFGKNAEWLELSSNEEDVEEWKQPKEISASDIKIIHKIRASILEIFLQDAVNEENLTLSNMTVIATSIAMGEISNGDKNIDKDSKIRRYLALKLLIKINELRPNTDDELSKRVRDVSFDELESSSFIDELSSKINDFIRFMFQEEDQDENMNTIQNENQGQDIDNDEIRYEEEKIEYIDKSDLADVFRSMFFSNDGNVWDARGRVENYIFDPILLELGFSYVEKDEKVLKDYEKYLLDHVKFFPITDNLKRLIEKAFFNTKFENFKSKYIDAMSFLDMRDTLIKIIVDTSINTELRKQAMEVSVKLLDKIDTLYFRDFSWSLLNSMKNIVSNLEEVEELRKDVEEKILLVEKAIAKHDVIKDLEKVVFSINISSEEKTKYLRKIMCQDLSFKKEDMSFITKVFDDRNLDIGIKIEVAYMIGIYLTQNRDILKVMSQEDIDSLYFLLDTAIEVSLYDLVEIAEKEQDLEKIKNYFERYIVEFGDIDYTLVKVNPRLEEKFIDFINLLNEKNGEILIDDDMVKGLKPYIKAVEIKEFVLKYINDDIENNMEQYYRFDLGGELLDIIEDRERYNDSIRKEAIKKSLDLFEKTVHFDKFSSAFLETIQNILDDTQESVELRNIADYILLKVKTEKSYLKNATRDCSLKFML